MRPAGRAEGRHRIGIVEDDADLRGYLATIIGQSESLEVAFCVGTLGEAKAMCDRGGFDLSLIDIGLPDGSGLDFVRYMKSRCAAKSLILTVLGDRQSVLLALEAGADGYLLKDTAPNQLRRSIELTLTGETPISPQAATFLLQMWKAATRAEPCREETGEAHDLLTPREIEILKLFSKGLSYRGAADVLGISPHTVGDHVKTIHQKLSVHSRTEAIFEARQLGLISPLE